MGALTLRRLTTQRLDAYYARLARDQGLSPATPATVRHLHALVRGALAQAVKWGWMPTNVAATASPPRLRKREITPPAMTDTRALLDAADEHDIEFGALLGISRTLAYQLARQYEATGGTEGLPVIRLGSSCLRVPRGALMELAHTGRVVTLPTIADCGAD